MLFDFRFRPTRRALSDIGEQFEYSLDQRSKQLLLSLSTRKRNRVQIVTMFQDLEKATVDDDVHTP